MIEKRLSISPSHPALPGHFPDEPIVPGVLLLDAVLSVAPARMNIPWAKFHAPLRPAEDVVIRVEQSKFSVHRGDTLIASGSLRPA